MTVFTWKTTVNFFGFPAWKNEFMRNFSALENDSGRECGTLRSNMHELSLMTNLLDAAVATAGGAPVCALRIRVGPLSGVVTDALRFAFEALSPGTPAAGARLDIEETTLSFHCLCCGADYVTPVGFYNCPGCGAADGELRGGNELELVSIEVPDHV
jgi:hydrogenase nickel incorporation protein HypA/HybF